MPEPDQTLRLILASASPRRSELLEQLGLSVEARPVNIDETPLSGETPEQLVMRLSRLKACECRRSLTRLPQSSICLGADTVIDLDSRTLGKPENRAQAIEMLLELANREHRVLTGVCLSSVHEEPGLSCVVSTMVQFGNITPEQAARYWATGEPADKAGSYAIQGRGAQFVAHLSGSYSNVVGLPLYETAELLRSAARNFYPEGPEMALTDIYVP